MEEAAHVQWAGWTKQGKEKMLKRKYFLKSAFQENLTSIEVVAFNKFCPDQQTSQPWKKHDLIKVMFLPIIQISDVMTSDSLPTLFCPSVSSVDTNTSSPFQLRLALPVRNHRSNRPPTSLSEDIRAHDHERVHESVSLCVQGRIRQGSGAFSTPSAVFSRSAYTGRAFWVCLLLMQSLFENLILKHFLMHIEKRFLSLNITQYELNIDGWQIEGKNKIKCL